MSSQDEKPLKTPALALQMVQGGNATVLVIAGTINASEVPEACGRICGLLDDGGDGPLVCDIGRIERPGAATVDLLARLKLMAQREGRQMSLHGTSLELQGLLELAGLDGILNGCGSLSLEPRREPE